MTEDNKPEFPGDLEQEEFRIAVEDYDYHYTWGIGRTTFFNGHSLMIRGKWLQEPRKMIEFEWKMAVIDIHQTEDDPADGDDEWFHGFAGAGPPENWDIAEVGSVLETPSRLQVSMWLPRSAIIALLTMLSAEGEKEVWLVGSKLEDFNSDRLTPEQRPTQAEINALLSDLPESERGGLLLQPIPGYKTGNLHQISFSLKSHNQ